MLLGFFVDKSPVPCEIVFTFLVPLLASYAFALLFFAYVPATLLVRPEFSAPLSGIDEIEFGDVHFANAALSAHRCPFMSPLVGFFLTVPATILMAAMRPFLIGVIETDHPDCVVHGEAV